MSYRNAPDTDIRMDDALPTIPETHTAMKSPQNPDHVVVYESDGTRQAADKEWVKGEPVDIAEYR